MAQVQQAQLGLATNVVSDRSPDTFACQKSTKRFDAKIRYQKLFTIP